jgi:hypothetical protein
MLRDLDDIYSIDYTATEMASLALGIVLGLKFAGMPKDKIAEVWNVLGD